ncbi:MAG: NHLP bacteriocin export ABC transporter permease/ATPase subunit [Planctomycetaceae bacterium]|jgi:NHLM bacteriocin system ABC transporter ATP-binding protein|nr:NHLP bacteriocin export ABC transporter permease/ATPase subunit [Planctomycetaceae bacterium]
MLQNSSHTTSSRQKAVQDGVLMLLGVFNPRYRFQSVSNSGDPLFDACQIVVQENKLSLRRPLDNESGDIETASPIRIRSIARASGLQIRKISLETGWWKTETVPALGFLLPEGLNDAELSDEEIVQKGCPVAIVRAKRGQFKFIDPQTNQETIISHDKTGLSHLAFTFFQPFDDKKPVSLKTILYFVQQHRLFDIFLIILVGIIIGLLGLIAPIFTGWIVDSVIPDADRYLLIQLTLVLIAITISQSLLTLLRSYATLRIEGSATLNLESAIWDRLIRQPCRFFRDYSTGDLVSRANGINTIRQILTSSTLSTILSCIFCIPSIFLMFYYSIYLTIVAMLLLIICATLQIIGAVVMYFYQRQIVAQDAKVQNLTFQYFSGIEKIRSSFSEHYVFRNWATIFSRQANLTYISNLVSTIFGILSQLASPISLLVIYWFGMNLNMKGSTVFTAGTFMAFLSAFGTVRGGILGMTGSLSSLVNIVPIWKRILPILHSLPESTNSGASIPRLNGRIEVSHLTFYYSESLPPVLNDISFCVETGEFVAIVGESGTGKSTLLRLLLGFEKPKCGSIFYDDYDINNVDIHSLRRQFGVVLQSAGMMNADIFNNIAGGTGCSMEEAWEAAHLAGIADEINRMPLKMNTPISMNGGTVSGGQRQRIMIARAIVTKPRILFLDESTNALDNVSQSVVTENINALKITRFIIAHRLSTIRNADRIIVLQNGRIVQTGTFDELADCDGLFQNLMKRQMLKHV